VFAECRYDLRLTEYLIWSLVCETLLELVLTSFRHFHQELMQVLLWLSPLAALTSIRCEPFDLGYGSARHILLLLKLCLIGEVQLIKVINHCHN